MPVPQPDEVIQLAEDLKRARSEVAKLEERWAAFFSQTAVSVQFVPALNLKSRIIQFLESQPHESFSMVSVAKALDAKENSVGPYLSELAKEGKIEKRDRGLYGAMRPSELLPSESTDDDDDLVVTDEDIPF